MRRGSASRGSCRSPAIAMRSTSWRVEGVDHLVGVRDAVEVAPEARALDDLDRDAGGRGRRSIGTAFAVDEHRRRSGGRRRGGRAESCRCPTPAPRSASRWKRSPADPPDFRVLEVGPTAWSDWPKPRRLSGGRDVAEEGHGPEQTDARRQDHRRERDPPPDLLLLPLVGLLGRVVLRVAERLDVHPVLARRRAGRAVRRATSS